MTNAHWRLELSETAAQLAFLCSDMGLSIEAGEAERFSITVIHGDFSENACITASSVVAEQKKRMPVLEQLWSPEECRFQYLMIGIIEYAIQKAKEEP